MDGRIIITILDNPIILKTKQFDSKSRYLLRTLVIHYPTKNKKKYGI